MAVEALTVAEADADFAPAAVHDRAEGRAVLAIAAATGLASLAMNFWIPFIPLYMRHLGAGSDADAVFWAGLAVSMVGVARLVSGPVWGVISDRFGRKAMLVRALAFATATTLVAAVATEPWHVVVAFSCQGFFSGFVPAAAALTSVTVRDANLPASLGRLSAAQFLGTTVGPAAGAGVAALFSLRGAMVAAAVLPAVAASWVVFAVERDQVAPARHRTLGDTRGAGPSGARRPGSRWGVVNGPFLVAVSLYFALFAATQLVRLATPVALEDLGGGDVETLVGIAFTIGGAASVAGLVLVNRTATRRGRMRHLLAVGCIAAGAATALLALAGVAVVYIVAFALLSLVQAAMLPATNTLIASSVARERRGTAFGLASSAQALAFIAGPMGAAAFTATSLTVGFWMLAGAFVLVGGLAWRFVREPSLEG